MQATVADEESSECPRWYVIQCKPRQEWRALEHLERQSFTCYLPRLVLEQVQHGRTVERFTPLFPRYLFIRLDDAESNWYPIRSTRGVSQLVSCNDKPVAVGDTIIDRIRERLAQEARVPYLQPGQRVTITSGPFTDVEAIFVASDGNERVVLLMNILHREQQVSLPVGSVRRLA
jgi:transcriptional antiterminator RfaH